MNTRHTTLIAAAALAVCSLGTGCVTPIGGGRATNSHFAYPNSNVEPMGRAEGIGFSLAQAVLIPTGGGVHIATEKAIAEALQKSGGDLLLDYTYGAFMFQLGPLITFVWVTLEGTAAKMTVGLQKLYANEDEAYGQPAAGPGPGAGSDPLAPQPAARPAAEVAPAPAPTACASCASPLRAGAKFCTKCGYKN